jgi:hypothetical protein
MAARPEPDFLALISDFGQPGPDDADDVPLYEIRLVPRRTTGGDST